MNQKLLELLREEFLKEIGKKTGWGKNEIEKAFDRSAATAATRLLDHP